MADVPGAGRRRTREDTGVHDHPASEPWIDHARAELARAGHRAGGARTAVLETLAGTGCCQTAQEIHDLLRVDGGRRVGIASVYRVLDQLVGLRLVTKIEFGDGVSRFEAATTTTWCAPNAAGSIRSRTGTWSGRSPAAGGAPASR